MLSPGAAMSTSGPKFDVAARTFAAVTDATATVSGHRAGNATAALEFPVAHTIGTPRAAAYCTAARR